MDLGVEFSVCGSDACDRRIKSFDGWDDLSLGNERRSKPVAIFWGRDR